MADVPPGVITVTFAIPEPAGLAAVIVVALTTVTLVAAMMPKSTTVAPVKPVPVIVTKVPPAAGPVVGLRPVTAGSLAAMVSVKLWVASGDTPLEAVIVSAYVPAVPTAGVPASAPVPSPLFTKVTPDGSVPVSLNDEVGTPVVVTVNVPNVPVANVVLLALVIAGAWAAATVKVKLWVASGDTPLEAVIVNVYVPKVPAAGVPASVAVPSSFAANVTPEGSTPVSLSKGVGTPVVVTVKLLEMPVVNVVAAALVIAGARAAATVSVKLWVAAGDTPLEAVIVSAYVPKVLAAGVPASVAVPLSFATKVTPDGSTPVSLTEGVGTPVVVTTKLLEMSVVNVVAAALVIAGARLAATVSVKLWVASGDTPLEAVIVNGYVPALPAAGVPERLAVPLSLSTNVTPEGSVPDSLSEGVGSPVVVTVKPPDDAHCKRCGGCAGDRRRLGSGDGQREALGGVGGYAVGGGDRHWVRAGGTRSGRAAKRGSAVVVRHEGHARGQRSGLAQRRRRDPGCRHCETARIARRERRGCCARDCRGRIRDGDGQRETLGGVGGHTVGGGDCQRIRADGTHLRSAGKAGGPVAEVQERHARGQRSGLSQRRYRCRRWSSP